MRKYYKVILVRIYDPNKKETFYATYPSGHRKDFKAGQVVDTAYGESILPADKSVAVDGKFTVGDILYGNHLGWLRIVRK